MNYDFDWLYTPVSVCIIKPFDWFYFPFRISRTLSAEYLHWCVFNLVSNLRNIPKFPIVVYQHLSWYFLNYSSCILDWLKDQHNHFFLGNEIDWCWILKCFLQDWALRSLICRFHIIETYSFLYVSRVRGSDDLGYFCHLTRIKTMPHFLLYWFYFLKIITSNVFH